MLAPNSIPGLTRGTASLLPRQVLESRLRVIDRRRAEIEATLSADKDDSYQTQELRAEDHALANMRAECEAVLNPKPKPRRSPELQRLYAEQRERDLTLLRATIKQHTAQILWNAQREEAAGNHKQARLLRLMLPTIPEEVCRELGKPLALLAELDGPSVPRRKLKHG